MSTMARSRGLLARATLVLALAVGAIAAAPTAPAQAAGCWLTSCNDRDPQAMGCSTSSTYSPHEFTYMNSRFELRYSPNCNAMWSRVTNPSYTPPTSCNDTWISLQVLRNNRLIHQLIVQTPCGPGVGWTPMFGSFTAGANYDYVRTCVHRVWYTSAPTACTAAW
ncbi:hypothetical protein Cfla_3609 [Cellulomonas flavigena DSM 20109]|uniref:DUF2690 domain-containing protein n=1 Tax=Cellulomonas flavigena (strain ATCC 482 / DSM 20109 / BCRC 11376 / JCM 18109 / NBRC 3775 / NCIMB 8073 / NRS 134) TaxID=446466 RepID=D5UDM4_CELFN|nr:DUF2690 domain-containing protein [Cellulomonas flavigena]ADG76480.1 hypothetical protein Cfla_3609 [Cellulomonas flavigena DSM 20109]